MKKKILLLLAIITIFNIFCFSNIVSADPTAPATTPVYNDNVRGNLQKFAGSQGIGFKDSNQNTLIDIIGGIINFVLLLLGVVFLILIIISGIQWLTAEGNEDNVKKAKGRIKNALMGLIVTLLAYTIQFFIFTVLKQILFQ